MSGPEAIAAVVFFGGVFTVLRPVAAAIAKRISGEHRRNAVEPAERDEILSELQQVREELNELAERMDFAERFLAKQSEVKR
jgi:ubiquinone biosynthesis protein UbiJ